MNVVSRIKNFQGQVAEKMQRGEYSVFSIELIQDKPFKFAGEEYKKISTEK